MTGGTVYIGSADFGSADGKVYALDAATGHTRWTYTIGGPITSSPAVTGGTVYIGSDDHKVYALNAATGHTRWTYTTGGPIGFQFGETVLGGTVYIGNGSGTVYIGSADGKVYALDAATGHPRWTYTTGGPVVSRPAVQAAPSTSEARTTRRTRRRRHRPPPLDLHHRRCRYLQPGGDRRHRLHRQPGPQGVRARRRHRPPPLDLHHRG